MLDLLDADWNVLWVDIGANESAADAQMFNSSEVKEAVESGDKIFHQPGVKSSTLSTIFHRQDALKRMPLVSWPVCLSDHYATKTGSLH